MTPPEYFIFETKKPQMNQKILVLCIALALAGISCKKETGCGEYATTEPQVRWSNCRFEGCPNQPFQFPGTPGIWWLEDCFAYINCEQLNPFGYPTEVKLRCINPDNGQLKWETSLPDFDLPAKLISTGNEICLYDEQGKVHQKCNWPPNGRPKRPYH